MMGQGLSKVLLIGYGNPGRWDDGLGPALAAAVEKLEMPGLAVETAYQLNVEDAAAVAEYDVVVFADADVAGPEPFRFCRVRPRPGPAFSSHRLEPPAVLALARELFGSQVEAYTLAIRGYHFHEFGESLSPRAEANLAEAAAFIARVCREGSFAEAAGDVEESCVRPVDRPSEDHTCKMPST